jgi:pimeloyl-ACP methyl ester carboxylesterase
MAHVEVNGARLWVEEEGAGPAVLFLHGGLGDLRLFEPQMRALARSFRCIGFDRRLWGRSETDGVAFSWVDDAVGVLDALGVERAALVGLSFGGGLAIDVALAHPERVWALAHVAGGVTGIPADPYTPEQDAAFEKAEETGDLETAMQIDFDVWAPLGVDDLMRELWHATPEALGVPDGARPLPRPDAHERLEEITVPTLVVLPSHDPPAQRDAGATVARRVPGAQLVELDSDHYLTLRHADQVNELLLEFLTAETPE